MIDREILQEMFDSIAKRGDWDMSQPMLWGYFFVHPNADPLRAAVAHLEAAGYELVDLYPSDQDDSNAEDTWWLHVQRVEVHTVDSLFARNEQLYEFAEKHGIDSYDGMDVGPVEAEGRPS